MATLTNREVARDHLVSLMTSEISEYKAVYGYLKKRLGGLSPVAMVDTVGTRREFHSDSVNPAWHRFMVWHFVHRDDEATAEDTLDSLEQKLAQLARDYPAATGKWAHLQLGEGDSQADYVTIDGVQYRAEGIILEAKVSP